MYEDVPEEKQPDVELSPTSKMVKRYQEKLKRGRTENRLAKNKLRKEMERYEGFVTPGKHVKILHWWKQHEAVLPLLASLAKKILAIPASSSKSERVFSTGGNIVTAKRNRLSPKNVESLIVIKENMALIDNFDKNSGYKIKKFNEESNPFKKVEMEEVQVQTDTEDDGSLDMEDMDDEDILYLDFIDDSDDDEDESGDEEDFF